MIIYLLVDDFGLKYVGKHHTENLITCIKKDYPVSVYWNGGLYYGVSLEWDYKQIFVTLSMAGYAESAMHEYQQKTTTRPQNAPHK